MTLSPPQPAPAAQLLGKSFQINELAGRASKYLNVPPGRQGVVIRRDGWAPLYPPGSHRVLTAWQRLRGLGVGLHAGFVPAGPFSAWLQADNLLSGDGELLDARLLCSLEVADPQRFFSEQVLPRKALEVGAIDLSDSTLAESLAAWARRYAAEDLRFSLPSARLFPELQTALQPSFDFSGLRLNALQLVSFQPADDRLLIAEKVQALNERLQDVALQKKMAELDNQTQLDGFIQQLDPELPQKIGLRLPATEDADAAASTSAAAPASLPDQVRSWFIAESGLGKTGLNWRMQVLLGKAKKPRRIIDHISQANLRHWMNRRTIELLLLIGIGYGLSYLVRSLTAGASWADLAGLLFVIWTPILGLVVNRLIEYVRKREQAEQEAENEDIQTDLDDLSYDDRQRAEQLVREQCRNDLTSAQQILEQLRSKLYRLGQEDLALRMRELERHFAANLTRLGDTEFGKPAYLSDLNINGPVWYSMVGYDERLLASATLLQDSAERLQQKYTQQQRLEINWLDSLESQLDEFMHRFEARSRAMRFSQ